MKIVRALFGFLTLTTIWYSCTTHDLYEPALPLQINLRWVRNYPQETQEMVVNGLLWNLSYLGAALPSGSSKTAMTWTTPDVLKIDFSRLGFSPDAEETLIALLDEIKRSDEYRFNNSVDIGRFVMLTLNSSYHYFAITGVSPTLKSFKSKYAFMESTGAVTNSSIAKGHRKVWIGVGSDLAGVAFIAAEGTGSLVNNDFVEEEYETLDVMENGQLRFGLYDKEGKLKASSNDQLTLAGKPSKCLWCHEINLQSLNEMDDVPNYISQDDFKNLLEEKKMILNSYRESLRSEIDFSEPQDHTLGELLYIGFMEPSISRLAREWNMSEDEVDALTSNLPTHQHHEFPFLGNELFERKSVEQFLPYKSLPVPDDAREPSAYEPQIIQP